MRTIATIGLEIAKSVFQVHGVDAPAPEATTEATSHYANPRASEPLGSLEGRLC
jgi:hypothetical protein